MNGYTGSRTIKETRLRPGFFFCLLISAIHLCIMYYLTEEFKYFMDLQKYVDLAVRTESVPDGIYIDRCNLTYLLGLFQVSGQLLDGIKRSIYYKNDDRFNENFATYIADLKLLIENIEREAALRPDTLPADLFKGDKAENVDVRLFHGVIGIATEAAELIENVTPTIVDVDATIDVVNLDEELGDVNWYEAIITHAGKLDWAARQARNIAKLQKRYPEKYTDEAAVNRDTAAERVVLEEGIDGRRMFQIDLGGYTPTQEELDQLVTAIKEGRLGASTYDPKWAGNNGVEPRAIESGDAKIYLDGSEIGSMTPGYRHLNIGGLAEWVLVKESDDNDHADAQEN